MPFNRNKARLSSAQERIQRVEEYLKTIHSGRPLSAVPPLWNLRALHDECKHAGHDDLSELCAELESRVIQLQMNRSMQDSVMTELLGMTKNISQRVTLGFDNSMRDAAGMESSQDPKLLAET